MGWIGCVHCEKFQCDLMAQTSPLIATAQPILHWVSCSNKTLPNAPKHYEMLQNMSLFPMGWIECVLWKKKSDATLRHKLVHWLRQFNPFCTEFHVVTKHWQMHPNATKTDQTMSLGSNGVDRVRSLPKIPMRVHGSNFCINCTSSAYFAPSFMQ